MEHICTVCFQPVSRHDDGTRYWPAPCCPGCDCRSYEYAHTEGDDMTLDNIKIGHSPLTNSLYLYRHGVDPNIALDKRPAEQDVFTALILHMMHGFPTGSEKTVALDGKQYVIRVAPAAEPDGPNPSEDPEIVTRLTAAMREADRDFEGPTGGGGTRHHVRDYLLPILEKHGLAISCI